MRLLTHNFRVCTDNETCVIQITWSLLFTFALFVLTIPLSISTWFLKYQVSLDFFSISNSKKKSILKQTQFFVEFELDFYCLCSLQKSISKSNWFLNFLNLIFRNWKKIEWHSIFQKSSEDRQGERLLSYILCHQAYIRAAQPWLA